MGIPLFLASGFLHKLSIPWRWMEFLTAELAQKRQEGPRSASHARVAENLQETRKMGDGVPKENLDQPAGKV